MGWSPLVDYSSLHDCDPARCGQLVFRYRPQLLNTFATALFEWIFSSLRDRRAALSHSFIFLLLAHRSTAVIATNKAQAQKHEKLLQPSGWQPELRDKYSAKQKHSASNPLIRAGVQYEL